ncbi:hypothetical protein TGPRC2_203100 [Toxoplasma gondii TgCatPRC2]|uniref:Uncharacterized protein n=15 Tax=Toxoplasma gondii TaxID=5811 RepID=A0A125YMD7_TOXGV|nr:hypothetical protein TGME49_203100 [Toxoplasma gondii ME49]EPR61653.1 hypothetical protein TGGT1_203100 [Toxoplasma gondii GT1]ESS32922.1 hypothetical protein TGVEG_203100 [Toxoplasma gondii VEG]KAF4642863.1 hypothetical protein TGRH88_035920 [Toxoplasma gondii]KFG37732.1 hypothetical protein TGDOM2_203100 [Toxoplasma gondii GAB2-2007-GAL-DOM2]KFG46005.1 hypothetical protein TGP89_203100 [Toxoplasma gondii p89]KFG53703.1 hypothetical protein TGFOU_203100 [Toxoplasma gondii FOU]KFG61922.1 |eukprot:XP_002367592.1 hypothetical protein TGME49_203100 [Toxoplasma gondii ME49]
MPFLSQTWLIHEICTNSVGSYGTCKISQTFIMTKVLRWMTSSKNCSNSLTLTMLPRMSCSSRAVPRNFYRLECLRVVRTICRHAANWTTTSVDTHNSRNWAGLRHDTEYTIHR